MVDLFVTAQPVPDAPPDTRLKNCRFPLFHRRAAAQCGSWNGRYKSSAAKALVLPFLLPGSRRFYIFSICKSASALY